MLASDLLWHIGGREATAAVGYDVTLRQARLQGKIDSTGQPHRFIRIRLAHWLKDSAQPFAVAAALECLKL